MAIVCCAAIGALTVSPAGLTQSRIVAPQRPANSNTAAKRQRVTTLRASDSTDGSRVALSADQSLNDYEAYRRGDRFYVRIPAADVPRPEAVRGRAFGDVKVQRGAKDTVVSFRLQPGATARVEQRGNKLDVLFTMPGARSSSASTGPGRNDAGPAPPPVDSRRDSTGVASSRGPSWMANRNSNDRTGSGSAQPAATPRSTPSPKPSPAPSGKPSPGSTASPTRSSLVVAEQRRSPSPTATPSQTTAQSLTWTNVKQRARYWILLAQLNPIPVAIAVALLLLLIGLLVLQRRRAKATRRARGRKAYRADDAARVVKTGPVAVKRAEPVAADSVAEPAITGAVLAVAPAAVVALTATEPETPTPPPPTDAQHERVTRATEEVKKLMAGGDYDESIVASDDRYTRQLVGAELLSALVGRNLQRRERARAAFMNHGYFDDATRDLRIAESPNERAAAARRLSFVHDREATPHLIAALEDSSPDVRRAAIEALMDLRDPAAISPLNSLMKTETDRRVPRSLIKHAIEACATSGTDEPVAPVRSPEPAAAPISQTPETEREVIEI